MFGHPFDRGVDVEKRVRKALAKNHATPITSVGSSLLILPALSLFFIFGCPNTSATQVLFEGSEHGGEKFDIGSKSQTFWKQSVRYSNLNIKLLKEWIKMTFWDLGFGVVLPIPRGIMRGSRFSLVFAFVTCVYFYVAKKYWASFSRWNAQLVPRFVKK